MVAADLPVFNGTTVADHFTQPSHLPDYVTETATALNAVHHGTRVLAIPGENFAAYRYGDVIDPVWPGLLRPAPSSPGSSRPSDPWPPTTSFTGLDNPMQNGIVEPRAIAPLARLMSAGDVLLPRTTWPTSGTTRRDHSYPKRPRPPPRGRAVGPGRLRAPRPDISQIPITDEEALATSPDQPWPAPEQVIAVARPPAHRPGRVDARARLVVDGDGVGLDEAASAGLLNTDSTILYARTLDTHKTRPGPEALDSDSTFVLTTPTARRPSAGTPSWATPGRP